MPFMYTCHLSSLLEHIGAHNQGPRQEQKQYLPLIIEVPDLCSKPGGELSGVKPVDSSHAALTSKQPADVVHMGKQVSPIADCKQTGQVGSVRSCLAWHACTQADERRCQCRMHYTHWLWPFHKPPTSLLATSAATHSLGVELVGIIAEH